MEKNMTYKHCKSLELDKVLKMLSHHASCEDAKEMAVSVEPQKNLDMVQSLVNQTNDAHIMLARFGGPSFGGLKNVNNALQLAFSGAVLSMRDLLNVASTLKAVRSLVSYREKCAQVNTCLNILFDSMSPNKYLEDKIYSAILSEDEIADTASDQLEDIRRKMRAQESKIREQLDRIIRSSHYQKALQEPIVTMRNGRFVVPVKQENRADVPGLVHDTSASGSTVFIEPMAVVDANNEIKVLKSKERDEIERILIDLSAQTGSFAQGIKSSYECAVELDLIFAKAHLAYSMKASVPVLNNTGSVNLKSARHPLIDQKAVVPTDIRLGEDFDTLVITGPNTGGKTVAIKTIGLLTLMVMCGLMIPAADDSHIAVFDNIFADIGDEQSIEQSLSTFSSHMKNVISIIEKSDDKTLVLIDELGAGTDPVEGAAIAIAILERLHIAGAKVAATTHYAELKAYAIKTPRVENGSCEFDVSTLRPTYRLLIGVPGRSNAFAISERLGMDTQVVNRARELVSTENSRFEDVVEKLESSRTQMEKEHQKAQELSIAARKARQEAEQIKIDVDELRQKEIKEAREQAARIVEKARRESETFIDEIEKLKKASKDNRDISNLAAQAKALAKQHNRDMDNIINPVDNIKEENYELPRNLVLGDTVLIADIGEKAQVISLPDKKNIVEVQAGLIKTRVPVSNLRLIQSAKKSTQSKTRTINSDLGRGDMKINTTCDIRGMAADDGILTLDRFIDTQVRTGLTEFTVIHGKGTGVLRKAVGQYLKKHPMVKEHRLGTFGEGEDGVTIVTLK
ncbi:MAG: endonuclease MutS2 [Oscillospiraceae bacterium]|jgi:DNA mismatch repair protein MutS2|nr:endonuclease MutS2 [Oscillospiraceae bacterium]